MPSRYDLDREALRQVVEDVALLTVPGEEAPLLRLSADPQPVRLAPGGRGRIAVRVASSAHASVAVEAWLISPWGTWELGGPRATLFYESPTYPTEAAGKRHTVREDLSRCARQMSATGVFRPMWYQKPAWSALITR